MDYRNTAFHSTVIFIYNVCSIGCFSTIYSILLSRSVYYYGTPQHPIFLLLEIIITHLLLFFEVLVIILLSRFIKILI